LNSFPGSHHTYRIRLSCAKPYFQSYHDLGAEFETSLTSAPKTQQNRSLPLTNQVSLLSSLVTECLKTLRLDIVCHKEAFMDCIQNLSCLNAVPNCV
jgi:hypothetical protein